MRQIGSLHPSEGIPLAADTFACAVLAAGTHQAFDYPSTGCDIVRLSGATTAGAAYGFVFNNSSTSASWPATSQNATTAGATQANALVPPGEARLFQVPRGSTGFSLIGGSSGIVTIEFWKR